LSKADDLYMDKIVRCSVNFAERMTSQKQYWYAYRYTDITQIIVFIYQQILSLQTKQYKKPSCR